MILYENNVLSNIIEILLCNLYGPLWVRIINCYKPLRIDKYIIVLLILLTSSVIAENMDKIKILNSEFEIIRIIISPDELKMANNEWLKLKPLETLPNFNWTHKFDISSESIGGRWLYNKEGYLAKLNKMLKPAYKVTDVVTFNKVYLGL